MRQTARHKHGWRTRRRAAARLLSFAGSLLAAAAGCSQQGLGLGLPPWSALACGVPDTVPPPLPVRGANLVGFRTSEYVDGGTLAGSLQDLAAVGGNWVAVNFWWFQDHAASTAITPDPELYTISDAAIEAAISGARAQGLEVVLRPAIDLRDGDWRGHIPPSDTWFDTYRAFITRYADLAQQWGAAALSVGVELSATESHETAWRELIAAVRATYTGALVYCANHGSALQIDWWDAVDIIGVDAYYAVARRPGADAATMACAWSYWLDRLDEEVVARFPGRPVWLTEVGTLAARGSPRRPACYAGICAGLVDLDHLDLTEQANYYRAALLAAGQRDWLTGLFWWSWYPDPSADYVRAADYSPQGKPAEDVLREFWAGVVPGS